MMSVCRDHPLLIILSSLCFLWPARAEKEPSRVEDPPETVSCFHNLAKGDSVGTLSGLLVVDSGTFKKPPPSK